MTKKILIVFLNFMLLLGFISLTYAKQKTTIKGKTSIAVDVLSNEASLRIWTSNKMGIDFSAGLGFQSDPSAFSFNFGAGLVFPMFETSRLNVYIVPETNIGFTTITNNLYGETIKQNVFKLLAGAGFQLEGFIVPEVLSFGSSIGVFIGIQNSDNTTTFIFDIARGVALNPLIVRFYF